MPPLPLKITAAPGRWVEALLDAPDLPQRIRSMAPGDLLNLVRQAGLEDSAGLIALADAVQLGRMLDEDLWRSPGPGAEERFDPARFGLWLEVLNDMDPALAAQRLAELDPLFVVMALSKHLAVFGARFLQQLASGGEEAGALVDKQFESRLNHDFGDFIAVALDDRAWDPLLAILLELENRHQEFFLRLFRHLAALSSEDVASSEDLRDRLSLAGQLENDLQDEREQAREWAGYVTPVQAAEWLRQTRSEAPPDLLDAPVPEDTRRYFDRLAGRELRQAQGLAQAPDWLKAVGQARPKGGQELRPVPAQPAGWAVHRALQALAGSDPQLHALRLQELTYLANLLMAGCAYQGRVFRHVEAAQAAIATCNLGLEIWLARPEDEEKTAEDRLRAGSAVALFRAGYALLHRIAVQSARQTIALLTPQPKLRKGLKDRPWIEKQLAGLAADLEAGLGQGRPWQAADQLILLETILESTPVSALLGLIAEFPTWPADQSGNGFIHSLKTAQEIEHYLESIKSEM